jgi:hypothetical protein
MLGISYMHMHEILSFIHLPNAIIVKLIQQEYFKKAVITVYIADRK